MQLHMLTTIDNPYDVRTQWDQWFAWDQAAGYNTPALLDRLALTSDSLSETDQDAAIEAAIDDAVKEIGPGLYRKVPINSGKNPETE